VYSPLSLQLALAMVTELAYGKTQQEIIEKAHISSDAEIRHFGAQHILKEFNTDTVENEPVALMLANGAWASSDCVFRSEIEATLQDFYLAALKNVDFIRSFEQTRQEINNWVESNTQGKIQGFMPAGSITSSTRLVLVNTLFMRAPWQNAFDPLDTYEDIFYGPEKSLQSVPFMRKIQNLNLLEETTHTVIELPFKKAVSTDAELSLFVVLPHEDESLEELENQLSSDLLTHWIDDTDSKRVDLSLPKFKLSSSINAKEVLQKMGLRRPFATQAEFDLEGYNSGLYISDIFHQATFEVDEWGGVGSAATGIVLTKTAMYSPLVTIKVDRPFLVVVVDKSSKVILFAGRVMQPRIE